MLTKSAMTGAEADLGLLVVLLEQGVCPWGGHFLDEMLHQVDLALMVRKL